MSLKDPMIFERSLLSCLDGERETGKTLWREAAKTGTNTYTYTREQHGVHEGCERCEAGRRRGEEGRAQDPYLPCHEEGRVHLQETAPCDVARLSDRGEVALGERAEAVPSVSDLGRRAEGDISRADSLSFSSLCPDPTSCLRR